MILLDIGGETGGETRAKHTLKVLWLSLKGLPPPALTSSLDFFSTAVITHSFPKEEHFVGDSLAAQVRACRLQPGDTVMVNGEEAKLTKVQMVPGPASWFDRHFFDLNFPVL